jgi:hypothetical protein
MRRAMNPALARRIILTASLFQATRNGPGLSAVSWEGVPARILWVHHEDDPCTYTSYRDAKWFSGPHKVPDTFGSD